VAVLFDLANEVNRNHSTILAKQLKDLAGVLGLLQRDPNSFLQSDLRHGGLSDESISTQITLRNVAKKDKKYSEADRIRKELTAEGIMLEDGPTGTTWRRI
jgi:cysteinyl-tRNA synthetase